MRSALKSHGILPDRSPWKKHGTPPPVFEERSGFLIVTFRAQMVAGNAGEVESRVESKVGSGGDLPARVLAALRNAPLSKALIAKTVGKRRMDGQLHARVRDMLGQGLLAYTIPDKPNSRLQKYRLTENGRQAQAVKRKTS